MGCNSHNPVQHRDGKEPWCQDCGLTKNYRKPKSMFEVEVEKDEDLLPEPKVDMHFGDKDLVTAVFEALGAASACWSNLEGAGEFLSDSAEHIGVQLIERIEREMY